MPNKMQFFHWPDGKNRVIDAGLNRHRELSEFYERGDFENINDNWKIKENDSKYKFSRNVGSLFNVRREDRETVASYIGTEYKVYSAIASPLGDRINISDELKNRMRLSSVGGIVFTLDDKIVIQRRDNKLIAGGKLDSGVAGVCTVDDIHQTLDFDSALYEKLNREIQIKPSEVSSIRRNSLFSNMTNDYSGMIGYTVKVGLEFGQLNERINKNYVSELVAISPKEIISFIIDRKENYNDIIGDGCASLLSAMEPVEFMEAVKELRKRGESIEFGTLDDGVFVPDNSL